MFRVGSIFIPVTNLDQSKKWYQKNLGVSVIDEWEFGEDKGLGMFFPSSPTQLGLVQVEKPQPMEFTIKGKKKNVYFNFVVDEIETVHRDLIANGVTTTEIEDFGGMKGFEFFDPDGNPFSVVSEEENSPFHSDQILKRQRG
ncbi:VOC family protein [Jeotgalibacillus sp. ET6]|uniref:VOC family protein n=1 Tax=Jeotgalibacillus sp. ET6 TaxID=3037260 RepID=UPI00241892C2|nr:VOC family protein [Jeotgalibacillus sp. ET6]MDG5472002.1 VOC family protein [Jeotgalibacillus sp. ET6]